MWAFAHYTLSVMKRDTKSDTILFQFYREIEREREREREMGRGM